MSIVIQDSKSLLPSSTVRFVAEVISSSKPFDAHCPQVNVDLPSNTLTLTVEKKNTAVDIWKLVITNLSDTIKTHVFLVPAKVPKQQIPIPTGVLLQDVRYTLIVEGLQDIDIKDHPGTKFKVVCKTATSIPYPITGRPIPNPITGRHIIPYPITE